MINDLRIDLRVRNNVLYHAVFDLYGTVAEFCRTHGFAQDVVGGYLNLTKSPRRKGTGAGPSETVGTLTTTAAKICEVTGIGANELFPPDLYSGVIPLRASVEIPSSKYVSLAAARRLALPAVQEEQVDQAELDGVIRDVLGTLSKREQHVIASRFGLLGNEPKTLQDIARDFAVSQERVRQIEAKALRKLRHPSRRGKLRSYVFANPVKMTRRGDMTEDERQRRQEARARAARMRAKRALDEARTVLDADYRVHEQT